MQNVTPLAASLIGKQVVDQRGRHLGWVIAVIHRPRGADLLVERRTWLVRRHSLRFGLSDLRQLPDGTVLVVRDAADSVKPARRAAAAPEAITEGRR